MMAVRTAAHTKVRLTAMAVTREHEEEEEELEEEMLSSAGKSMNIGPVEAEK